jgi:hypothetical protein
MVLPIGVGPTLLAVVAADRAHAPAETTANASQMEALEPAFKR